MSDMSDMSDYRSCWPPSQLRSWRGALDAMEWLVDHRYEFRWESTDDEDEQRYGWRIVIDDRLGLNGAALEELLKLCRPTSLRAEIEMRAGGGTLSYVERERR